MTQMQTLGTDTRSTQQSPRESGPALHYATTNANYFKNLRFTESQQKDHERNQQLHKFMRGAALTKSLGGHFSGMSEAKESLTPLDLSSKIIGRRNQDEQTGWTNRNKIGNISLTQGHFTVTGSPKPNATFTGGSISSNLRQEIKTYGNKNHFELGLDPEGGFKSTY